MNKVLMNSTIHVNVKSKRPGREAFTAAERRLIQCLNTPAKVQRYLSSMPYNREKNGPTLRSFRELIRHKEAHCLESAVAAAVILEQHGYSPLLLDLESHDLLDHVLFVFKHAGGWGAIGRSRDIGLHGRKPVYRSLRDLAWSYFDPFVDFSGRLKGYAVTSLYELGDYDWRFSPRQMRKIEEHLRTIPHQRLRSSDQRYEKLLARYHRYKKRYPDRSPSYYDSRAKWML
jgi:phosphatidylserine/phosphatidylglycerophosphate/cardiolipin synthase-like enzyme